MNFPRIHEILEIDPKHSQPVDGLAKEIESFLDTFESATGWVAKYHEIPFNRRHQLSHARRCRVEIIDMSEKILPGKASASRDECDKLINQFESLVNQLHQSNHQTRLLESELAANIPVLRKPSESEKVLSLIDSILTSAIEHIGASSAALYLLNDDTSELCMRANIGLPSHRFCESNRPLETARADLEAMVGHVVEVKDFDALEDWNVPVEANAKAAICVPVSSISTPLGTLWLYLDEPINIDEDKSNVLEILAGRIASELERESAMMVVNSRSKIDEKTESRDQDSDVTFLEKLPTETTIDSWHVLGKSHIEKPSEFAAFHDWRMLPENKLGFFAGSAKHAENSATLTESIRSAIQALPDEVFKPNRVVHQINNWIYRDGFGDQYASLFCGQIDLDTGLIHYCSSGDFYGLVLRGDTFEEISGPNEELGHNPERKFQNSRQIVLPTQSLMLVSSSARELVREDGFIGGFDGWVTKVADGVSTADKENIVPVASEHFSDFTSALARQTSIEKQLTAFSTLMLRRDRDEPRSLIL